jgi:hypothetical protein
VDWHIAGPHGLRAAWTHAMDAKGNTAIIGGTTNQLFSGTYRPAPCYSPVAVAVVPCGDNGANLYQIRYVYTFSKRTEFNFGYVYLDNDRNAAYALGGLTAPNVGSNQGAFAMSMRHTF